MNNMRINGLRKELDIFLRAADTVRPPALRRSLQEEWLYSSDLPMICTEAGLEETERRLKEAGWETGREAGWLVLRKDVCTPPEDWFDGPFGPEAVCCRSLLARHPGRTPEGTAALQRRLIKAAEEGETAFESACGAIHREWAVLLRKREKLPEISPRYFGGE